MKRNKALIYATLCFFIIVAAGANAQVFRTLAVKGSPKLKKQGFSTWTRMFAGTKLNEKDLVKLGKDDYVSLVYTDCKTLELFGAGSHTVEELVKQVAARKRNLAQKYIDFVLDEMTDENTYSSKRQGANMSKAGAVERAANENAETVKTASSSDIFDKPVDNLIVVYPKNSTIIDDKVTFKWRKLNGAKEYALSITNGDGKKLIEKTTTDNFLTIDLAALNLVKNANYYWALKSSGGRKQTSEEFIIFVPSDENIKLIADTVAMIKSDFSRENSPACMLILARFYESRNIQNRAYGFYEALIAANPESNDFKKAYFAFLGRMNEQLNY